MSSKGPQETEDDAQKSRKDEKDSGTACSNDDDEPSLPKLLAALAMGARAVHCLPLGDDFAFQSSFPEFSELAETNRERLVEVLGVALQDPSLDSTDPLLWEQCADACDALLEQAEAWALSKSGDQASAVPAEALKEWSVKARQQAQGNYNRMVSGIVDMEKPQLTYQIAPQNDRTKPFIPNIQHKHFATQQPLDLSLKPGHGLESRFPNTTRSIPPDVVAPSHHVPHVYQVELESLTYQPWQLQAPSTTPPKITAVTPLKATWVDTEPQLQQLQGRLESAKLVAIDLEAHSHRSFAGLTCLMQLTVQYVDDSEQRENYLVDVLKLRHLLHDALAPTLANPAVLKVMHGADADVAWLQRDFGLYVVNLFDTGRAARALNYPSAGLAYLLQRFVEHVQVDKTHQLSDWRQRPLPESMRQYAIMDTHYLLDIYSHLLYELHQHPDASIERVLQDSRDVCLIRYDKEPFYPQGYKSLLRSRRRTHSHLTASQERVLARLFDWRDLTARSCDESLHFVCPNNALVRMSLACPTTIGALQNLFHPMPPLLIRFATQVLELIKEGLADPEEDELANVAVHAEAAAGTTKSTKVATSRPSGAPSSAFFKPASVNDEPEREEEEDEDEHGMPSPVLGTEEMYKQAGWMTPQVAEVATTTTEEEDCEGGSGASKPRKLLAVDSANKHYQSKRYTTHSLAMGGGTTSCWGHGNKADRTADGLGAARGANGDASSVGKGRPSSLEEQAKRAQREAARIRTDMSQGQDLLGLISPTAELEEGADPDRGRGGGDGPNKENVDSDEDFVIPKSMREIYKISNRNRRNKNSISPTNLERSGPAPEPMEVDTLEGAEAVLAASGYYDEEAEGSKRQRTKSGGDGKNAVPSREDDIEFMKEIGWIRSKAQLDAVLVTRPRTDGDGATESAGQEGGDQETATEGESSKTAKGSANTGKEKTGSPFDYSTVGPIGVYNPKSANPFFAGASAADLASQSKKQRGDRRRGPGRGKSSRGGRHQEKPERKDGRSFTYKRR